MYRALWLLAAALILSGCDDWRMWETPAVKPHEEPLLVMASGTVPFSGDSEAALKATVDLTTLAPPLAMSDPEVIASGRAAYTIYCAQCHGRHLDGMGTVGQSFQPLPRDLRSDMVQADTAGELFYIISYSLPGLRHPGLATTITVEDRWRIVAFLKSESPEPKPTGN